MAWGDFQRRFKGENAARLQPKLKASQNAIDSLISKVKSASSRRPLPFYTKGCMMYLYTQQHETQDLHAHKVYTHGKDTSRQKHENAKSTRAPAAWLALRQDTPVTSKNPSLRPGRSNTREQSQVNNLVHHQQRGGLSTRNKKRTASLPLSRTALAAQSPLIWSLLIYRTVPLPIREKVSQSSKGKAQPCKTERK